MTMPRAATGYSDRQQLARETVLDGRDGDQDFARQQAVNRAKLQLVLLLP
jgi:hypothetical protein